MNDLDRIQRTLTALSLAAMTVDQKAIQFESSEISPSDRIAAELRQSLQLLGDDCQHLLREYVNPVWDELGPTVQGCCRFAGINE